MLKYFFPAILGGVQIIFCADFLIEVIYLRWVFCAKIFFCVDFIFLHENFFLALCGFFFFLHENIWTLRSFAFRITPAQFCALNHFRIESFFAFKFFCIKWFFLLKLFPLKFFAIIFSFYP